MEDPIAEPRPRRVEHDVVARELHQAVDQVADVLVAHELHLELVAQQAVVAQPRLLRRRQRAPVLVVHRAALLALLLVVARARRVHGRGNLVVHLCVPRPRRPPRPCHWRISICSSGLSARPLFPSTTCCGTPSPATCAGSACVGSRVLVARCEEEEEGTLEWGDFLNFATDVLEDGARRPDARARLALARLCVCAYVTRHLNPPPPILSSRPGSLARRLPGQGAAEDAVQDGGRLHVHE